LLGQALHGSLDKFFHLPGLRVGRFTLSQLLYFAKRFAAITAVIRLGSLRLAWNEVIGDRFVINHAAFLRNYL
jgi:hypothetical protein